MMSALLRLAAIMGYPPQKLNITLKICVTSFWGRALMTFVILGLFNVIFRAVVTDDRDLEIQSGNQCQKQRL